MANNLNSNPLRVDTAATVISAYTKILSMQWIDDDSAAGGIIADTEGLTLTIDGVTFQVYVADISTEGAVVWDFTPSVPFGVEKLTVDTIDGGTLYIWKA